MIGNTFRLYFPILGGVFTRNVEFLRKYALGKLPTGTSLLIYIWNFHVLSNSLLIYICKLHWNPTGTTTHQLCTSEMSTFYNITLSPEEMSPPSSSSSSSSSITVGQLLADQKSSNPMFKLPSSYRELPSNANPQLIGREDRLTQSIITIENTKRDASGYTKKIQPKGNTARLLACSFCIDNDLHFKKKMFVIYVTHPNFHHFFFTSSFGCESSF